MAKIQKLPFDLPRCIVLLHGKTYYDSSNGKNIHVDQLQKYVTGNDPAVPESEPKEISELKQELMDKARWDRNY